MLKLMYITNDPAVAKIAADAGVDRIFIDMEVLGKAERQGDMDTVQSHHVPEDIAKVRAAIGGSAEIMARIRYEHNRLLTRTRYTRWNSKEFYKNNKVYFVSHSSQIENKAVEGVLLRGKEI